MKKIIALMLLVVCLPAAAIPREDVLECKVADGSKFVLKSKYDWSPLARLYRETADRINQEPYSVYYKKKHSLLLTDIGRNVSHSQHESDFQRICSAVGLFRGRPVALYKYFEAGRWIGLTPDAAQKLYVQASTVDQSEQVRSDLQRFDLDGKSAVPELNFAFVAPIDRRLVFEHPVTRDGEHVIAVFQSESLDNGKTWQDLNITTDAKIFEIGKALLDQSFIGQPSRFNGKKIQINEVHKD